MKNNIAINVKNINKSFYYFKKDIKILAWLFDKTKYDKRYDVLKDINLEIKRGESVGIMGVNGAGKSTLLKLISEIYHPTSGKIEVNGKISSLIELGAGFNSQLTGRENIYYKSQLMGLEKSYVNTIIDDIIDFADIGEYFDMPLSSYSSGMSARLGFSLAVNIDPDILIIDEVFAVGDSNFREKSREKTIGFFKEGKTILFVSHSESLIKEFCNKVVYLKDGEVAFNGPVEEGIQMYNNDAKKALYSPRFIVEDIQEKNSRLYITLNYGIGRGFTIYEELELDSQAKFVATPFNGDITCLFETYPLEDVNVEIIDLKKVVFSFDIKINFRINCGGHKTDKPSSIFAPRDFEFLGTSVKAYNSKKDLLVIEHIGDKND